MARAFHYIFFIAIKKDAVAITNAEIQIQTLQILVHLSTKLFLILLTNLVEFIYSLPYNKRQYSI